MTNSYNKRKLSGKPFRTTTRLRKACEMNVRVQVPTHGLVPRTSFGWYDYGIGEKNTKKRATSTNFIRNGVNERIECEVARVEKAYLMFLVLGIGCFGCEFVPCCALKNGNLRGNPNKRKKRKTKIGLVSLPPSTHIFRKHPRPHELSRTTNTHASPNSDNPPTRNLY